ncbi:MAG: biotin/lipoyl-binding protein, partial [Ramlibacter sp.]|nr:biotin/lipoyl-binding protein [Ramlibacter sp.]
MAPRAWPLLLAVALALAACGDDAGKKADGKKTDDKKAAAPRPSLTVTTTTAQQVMLPVTLSANGNLAAWQEASVGAETAGLRVAEVRVNVGDRVRKGQVLATFAADTLRADLAQARAVIGGIGDDLMRTTQLTAMANLETEAQRWATSYRAKVAAGTWSSERWVKYGNDLIAMAERYVRDAGDLATQFSRLANFVGDFGQWVVSHWKGVTDKIAALNREFERLGRERQLL